MSSVLDPAELSASPLADLHVIANELGVDGFRRLRKAELVDAILVAQGGAPVSASEDGAGAGAEAEAEAGGDDADEKPARRRSRAGSGRSRSRRATEETEEATTAGDVADETEAKDEDEDRPRRRSRGGRSRGGRSGEERGDRDRDQERDRDRDRDASGGDEERVVEGVVELLGNGSGFVRLASPEVADDDVYVSAAQVKRCELVTGDRVGGPVRPPRRSERFPSLIRVDTINGRPADEVSEGTKFEELPAAFPIERFELGSEDPTVKAIEWLTPVGKGSRVSVVGPAQAGKTEALVRLAGALGKLEGLEVSVVLAGARPEEVAIWVDEGLTPAATALLGASPDAQGQAVEQVVEQAKRIAARGGDAVVVVDSLEQLPAGIARRALAAARNIAGGGSLTVLAAAQAPTGGETTLIALDPALTAARRVPARDLAARGSRRPELRVGEA
ncbi:MAG TPA: Rho termination factor N-terminal domain-containing protein, partial [Solirubrobacteraceae bacterium]